ncbi:hypothetical protein PUN28_006414 [Cardiocondyla obscurior]|uniref:Uncharacterized protein n=1 Tax=Cardiocondyla obscurior TaxID=286306 RepID=A0AAW2GAI0_9HYME
MARRAVEIAQVNDRCGCAKSPWWPRAIAAPRSFRERNRRDKLCNGTRGTERDAEDGQLKRVFFFAVKIHPGGEATLARERARAAALADTKYSCGRRAGSRKTSHRSFCLLSSPGCCTARRHPVDI